MGDPSVGRVIADRYELLAPIKEGGMGRVYVALQRSLKRKVALKLIRPSMTSVARIADRFLVEAQSASQLNHPNVVSVYDFGQSGSGGETDLYLVMELLSGSDLRDVLEEGTILPPARIIDVLRQTLAGLAEAHEHGISHRDIKPENIFLETTRRGGDRVKLIDFGVARVEREESLTLAGQFVGTPGYTAPEQVHGEHGPLADIYSVGVVLFELLTGDVPFDDPAPVQILIKHQTAPRPDPVARASGREVPRALADVCMRAMAVDPARRYPNAEAMADALLAASESRGATRAEGSIFPRRSGRSSIPARAIPTELPLSPEDVSDFGHIESIVPQAPVLAPADSVPLLGRADELAWIRGVLAGDARCAVLHGRPGVGRSRLLREAAAMVERDGGRAVYLGSSPTPRNQIGYLGIRNLITHLAGLSADILATGGAAPEPAATGLRAIFSNGHSQGLTQQSARSSASAALLWALQSALANAGDRAVVLCIDDADLLDGASMLALGDAMRAAPLQGLKVLMTSLVPCDAHAGRGIVTSEVRGLAPSEVIEWLAVGSQLSGETRRPRVSRTDAVEPLYLEHVWAYVDDEAVAPASLEELIAARVEALFPAERRLLQALAVTGACELEQLPRVLPEDGLNDTLQLLVDAHFAEVTAGTARIAHRIIAEQAIALAPAGTIVALHASANDALPIEPSLLELRAFHSVRGRADFESFLLVEEATRLRTLRGDDDGAVMMLIAGLEAATTRSRRRDLAALSAETVYTRKLGAALLNAGYPEEAIQLLDVTVANGNLSPADKAVVLEQLAIGYASTGRRKHADGLRLEALERANESGDEALIQRLQSPPNLTAKRSPGGVYFTPFDARAPSIKSIAAMRAVAPAAVRPDPRREED